MTGFCDWSSSAELLHKTSAPLSLGLHVDLPLLPTKRNVQAALRQLEEFRQRLKREPDYIDSHRNHHILPYHAQAFMAVLKAAPTAKLRSYQKIWPFSGGLFGSLKGHSFEFLWKAGSLSKQSSKRLLNDSLFCQESLKMPLPFETWFGIVTTRLLNLPKGRHLFIFHPGECDALLRERDSLTDFRATEARYLESAEFMQFLQQNFNFVETLEP